MSGRKIHRKANEYLQYLKGEFSNQERHAFERDMEADPFEMEALEGLNTISADEAENEILSLHTRLRKRLRRKRKIAWYSAAASIASLLIIGTVFLQIYDLNPQRDDTEIKEELFSPGESADSDVLMSEEVITREVPQEPIKTEVEISETPNVDLPVPEVPTAREPASEKIVHVEAEAKPQEEKDQNNYVITETRAKRRMESASQPAAPQQMEMQKKASSEEDYARFDSREVSGVVVSGEDMEPIPGAAVVMKGSNTGVVTNRDGIFNLPVKDDSNSTIVASFIGMETQEYKFKDEANIELVLHPDSLILDEVVVVGEGIQITEESAQPSVGTAAFKQYIKANLQFPEVETTTNRAVVVLRFTVTTTGQIRDITSLRSPGNSFTQEAIRLLNEGPSWTPARKKNDHIEEIVRLRIVFTK